MIRILHTADWHIGQTFFGHDRGIEHHHFFDWLLATIKSHAIDVLLVAGDVFDVSNPSAAAQHELFSFIKRASHECDGLQIVMIAGNHDSASRLEAPEPLFRDISVTVHGVVPKRDGAIDYGRLVVPLYSHDSGCVEAYCLAVPFLRQGDYPTSTTDENSYSDGVRRFYTALLDECDELDKPLIVMGHLQATGSEIAERDYSERTIIGGLECVSPQLFADKQIAYTALGHIHKAQRVSGMDNVRYAGSPLPMSFAERHYRHGAVMVTISDGGDTKIERLDYTPMVGMLSVPEAGSASPVELFPMLASLPDRVDDALAEPYLEIKVALDEPDPMLTQRISEALEGKAVRLARIVSTFSNGEIEELPDDEEPAIGLQDMTPLQILRASYQSRYHTELPADIERLFGEVCADVVNREV
jgi:exonuclease SbcD